MTVFLDTHVAAFIHAGDRGLLSRAATELLEASSDILISPIVALELQYLFEVEKITFPGNEVVAFLRDHFGVVVDKEGMGEAVLLSINYDWTRDPFDRIITAHAAQAGAFLLTRDSTIRHHYRSAVW